MRSMDELFTAIGRHPRPTLSVWGDRDSVAAYKKCMKVTEESFPKVSTVRCTMATPEHLPLCQNWRICVLTNVCVSWLLQGIIVDIADCGHNVPFEKFEDLVKELLTFHKDAFEAAK